MCHRLLLGQLDRQFDAHACQYGFDKEPIRLLLILLLGAGHKPRYLSAVVHAGVLYSV